MEAVKTEKIAIIETGGKQYRVTEGRFIDIEIIPSRNESESVVFDKVLLVGNGEDIKIGNPYIKGTKVEGQVLKEDKQKKILITKFKNKTRYYKRQGHRQPYLRVKITKIA